MLGAVGSYTYSSFTSAVDAGESAISAVGSFIADYPVVAVVATLGAYELFGGSSSSGNPDHLGQNVDTKA